MARVQFGSQPGRGTGSAPKKPTPVTYKKFPKYEPKAPPPKLKRGNQGWDVFMEGGTDEERITEIQKKQKSMQARTADYENLVSASGGGVLTSRASKVSAADLQAETKRRKELEQSFGPGKITPPTWQNPSDPTTWEEFGVDEPPPTASNLIQKQEDWYNNKGWQGTSGYLSEADIAQMSRQDTADLRDIRPDSNPYRGAGRDFFDDEGEPRDYNPETDGAPENMSEVRLAQHWVNVTKELYKGIGQVIDEDTGEVTYSRTALGKGQVPTDQLGKENAATRKSMLEVPINTRELAMLELIEDVEAQIDFVSRSDREFRSDEEKMRITMDYQTQVDQMAQSFALQTQQVTNAAEWDRMQQSQQSRLAELDVQRVAATEMATLKDTFDTGMLDQQSTLNIRLQENQQQYLGEQNRLDRAIQRQEYEEGARASQAVERLRQKEIDLQQQHFQLTLFMSLAQSPEILYFLKNAGALDMFGDIMGDGGQALDAMIGRVGEQQAGGDTGIGNIQQLSRLSSSEQDRQMYALSAQTGSSDPLSILRGSAPMAHTNPVDPNAPLRGGAPNLSVSNVGSTASTPLSLSREGGAPPQSLASPAQPSSGVRVQGSGSMRPTKSMGDMDAIIKEYQEGRYTPEEGAAALNDIAISGPFTEDAWEALVRGTMAMTGENYSDASRRIMIGPAGDWRQYGLAGRGR
jgi:hypothetical protein